MDRRVIFEIADLLTSNESTVTSAKKYYGQYNFRLCDLLINIFKILKLFSGDDAIFFNKEVLLLFTIGTACNQRRQVKARKKTWHALESYDKVVTCR